MTIGSPNRRSVSALMACLVVAVLVVRLQPRPAVNDAGGGAPSAAWDAAAHAWPEAAHTRHKTYYASPTGSPVNPGSVSRPLDLATGLSAEGPLKPGDVLWLRGGTYRGNFRSGLTGAPGAMIVVAQYPGERAVLDGVVSPVDPVLRVDGSNTVYWGFEVTSSAPDGPVLQRGTGIDVFGPYTKFINLVIHHTGNGIGLWTPALAAEVYGCVIYQSGWDGTDRGHGHSIYVQNAAPAKAIVDNILFDGRSYGVHAYTEGGQIDNLRIEGNIAFDHGVASPISGPKANILVGGWRVAQHTVLAANLVYQRNDRDATSVEVGYPRGCSDAVIANNYFAGRVPISLSRCEGVEMTGNTFVGGVARSVASRFSNNHYVQDRPTHSEVFVRPNRYQRGRGNIAIFNWEQRATVPVDLSQLGLRPGERFEVRDVRNYFGDALAQGVYGPSTIDLPLAHMISPAGAGVAGIPGVPEFGAAVVVPQRRGLSDGVPWTSPGGEDQ